MNSFKQELQNQLDKAAGELSALERAYKAKQQEIARRLLDDQSDLFGDRQSHTLGQLFDVRADPAQQKKIADAHRGLIEKKKDEVARLYTQVNQFDNLNQNQLQII